MIFLYLFCYRIFLSLRSACKFKALLWSLCVFCGTERIFDEFVPLLVGCALFSEFDLNTFANLLVTHFYAVFSMSSLRNGYVADYLIKINEAFFSLFSSFARFSPTAIFKMLLRIWVGVNRMNVLRLNLVLLSVVVVLFLFEHTHSSAYTKANFFRKRSTKISN